MAESPSPSRNRGKHPRANSSDEDNITSHCSGLNDSPSSSPRKRHRNSKSGISHSSPRSPTRLSPPPGSPLSPKDARLITKVNEAKALIRTNIKPDQWGQHGYSDMSLWHRIDDRVPRIDYASVSPAEFAARYERQNVPVVIVGATEGWTANKHWQPEEFSKQYRKYKFKVGEDDDGNTVYMRYKYFERYCNSLAATDDSPLYIFDSSFPRRKSGKNREKRPLRPILDDYEVPKYFHDDLFQYTSSYRRPPFRWIVIGPERSGTGIHLDPLGTSAWNTLIVGYKRWCLFPPHISHELVNPPKRSVYYDQRDLRYGIKRVTHRVHDHEAATWFNQVYPNLVRFRDQLGMLEIVQKPGETVFVPGGWHHVVINLSFTVAITQNFCSVANFERVYLQARRGRPKMTTKWRMRLEAEARARGVDVDAIFSGESDEGLDMPDPREPQWDPQERGKFAYLVHAMNCLEMVPKIPGSSSSGSSSTDESSEDSEAD